MQMTLGLCLLAGCPGPDNPWACPRCQTRQDDELRAELPPEELVAALIDAAASVDREAAAAQRTGNEALRLGLEEVRAELLTEAFEVAARAGERADVLRPL